jgi:uncharacterized protein (DUF58 family)
MSLVSRFLDPQLVERLNHLQLSARRVVEGSITGLHRSAVKGSSVEFRQHRFYTPGDEPRRLDWRVLGRTDRPYIKEYDEETNLRCALVLDCSGSMAYGRSGPHGSKFDYAAKLLASLAYLMLGQSESIGLAACGMRLQQWLAPRSGSPQLARIIDALEKVGPGGPANLGACMQEVADRLGRRSLVIVVTDALAPVPTLRPGLARLHHDRHETIFLRILDSDEVNFPFSAWSRFRGLEGERATLCEPAVMRRTYLDQFHRHRHELETTCRVLGAEFHSFVTDKPLLDSITRFLSRRAG